jgi:hypothetical protein
MTIKLTDPNGFENAPFSYQIGTRVLWRSNHGPSGTIIDGICEGPLEAGVYSITYKVRNDDGTELMAKAGEIQRV